MQKSNCWGRFLMSGPGNFLDFRLALPDLIEVENKILLYILKEQFKETVIVRISIIDVSALVKTTKKTKKRKGGIFYLMNLYKTNK